MDGATNMGVTLRTWQTVGYDKNGDGVIDVADLKLLTKDDVVNRVLKPYYWDKCRADQIDSQSVAEILVDWLWGSGITAIKHIQEIVKVVRIVFIDDIIKKRPTNQKFRKGWLNRINDIKWKE